MPLKSSKKENKKS